MTRRAGAVVLLALAGCAVASVLVVAGCAPADDGEQTCQELLEALEREVKEIGDCTTADDCIVVGATVCAPELDSEFGCYWIYNKSRSTEGVDDARTAYLELRRR